MPPSVTSAATAPTKVCPRCHIEKPVDDFPPRKERPGARTSRCHECDRKRVAEAYAVAKAAAVAIYGGRCACGSTEGLWLCHADGDASAHGRVESQPAMVRRIVRLGRPLDDWRMQLLCRACRRTPPRDPTFDSKAGQAVNLRIAVPTGTLDPS